MFVVDLKANPPAVIPAPANVSAWRASGMADQRRWNALALVANQDDGTVSVLSINGKGGQDYRHGDRRNRRRRFGFHCGDHPPDGKRALMAESGCEEEQDRGAGNRQLVKG